MSALNLNSFLKNVSDAANDVLNKAKDVAISIVDQNDDGEFDAKDISIAAESIGNTVSSAAESVGDAVSSAANSVGDAISKGAQSIKAAIDEKNRLKELKELAPIFEADMKAAGFLMPKFICVSERDKKHAESAVCQGSVGYNSTFDDQVVFCIFQDSLEAFGLSFFPNSDCGYYYQDPTDATRYIAIEEYFEYMKVVRINELQRISQELGAKHFCVTYKEEQASTEKESIKVQEHIQEHVIKETSEYSHSASQEKYTTVEIAAEMSFPGHAPVNPTVRYMQWDPSIQNLIEMRMDSSSPLLHQKYMLKMSNSCGIKVNDALKIDAVIKKVKTSLNINVASEATKESKRYLEYVIDF